MKGQELKIIFRKDKAYLTAEKYLTFEQLNLPKTVLTFKKTAYWLIRVLNYIESEKKIFCEIISYQVGETEFSSNQKQLADKLKKIQVITFRSIDTNGFLRTVDTTTEVNKQKISAPKESATTQTIKNSRQFNRVIEETFYEPLKNIQFKAGGISFDKNIDGIDSTLEISISNSNILEEYDAVKNYFANVLKTKKIKVTVRIEITGDEITSTTASSLDVDKIDQQLIESVKFDVVKSIIHNKNINDENKSLFTMDECFNTINDSALNSNTFYNNEKDLFDDVLKISNTKHYKYLRFLSNKHLHDTMKLRFIFNPFSFMFLIKGARNYHFVWETLDTEEATYVWHLTHEVNDLKQSLIKIESIINNIRLNGKTAYIKSSDDTFKRIYHDYTEQSNGFLKWKDELEKLLT